MDYESIKKSNIEEMARFITENQCWGIKIGSGKEVSDEVYFLLYESNYKLLLGED